MIRNHGIDAEADYAYTHHNGACDPIKAGHHVAAFSASRNVPQRNEGQLMAAVQRQPVAVAIGVTAAFQHYHRGVMGGHGPNGIDHSVLIVGYGSLVVNATPPLPAVPITVCNQPAAALPPLSSNQRCFDSTGRWGVFLPQPAPCWAGYAGRCYSWSYSSCAAACNSMNSNRTKYPDGPFSLAALSSDESGRDHCSCGTAADITADVQARNRPLAECTAVHKSPHSNLTQNCSVSSGGCVCRAGAVGSKAHACPKIVNGTHCDEPCGNSTRVLVFGFNCTQETQPPAPTPPPQSIPYWIVKNSCESTLRDAAWRHGDSTPFLVVALTLRCVGPSVTGGRGYGDGGYIKMQRGLQHPYGLCCINCMPQCESRMLLLLSDLLDSNAFTKSLTLQLYAEFATDATAIKGPPPTPAPPPPPPAPLCNATSKIPQRCFNVSGLNVTTQLLPNPGGRSTWTDTTSWQACATTCAWDFKFNGNWSNALNNWTGIGWETRRTVFNIAGVQVGLSV